MPRAHHEQALQQRIEKMRTVPAHRLVWFAHACVHGTPLADGRTPVARLRGRVRLLDALLTVARWLEGESVERQLRAMHDEVFEAALGVGRFEYDMTGLRAACWSVFELYQAAVAAAGGELQSIARKAAWSAFLASRSADNGETPAALEYQDRLFQETLADELGNVFHVSLVAQGHLE